MIVNHHHHHLQIPHISNNYNTTRTILGRSPALKIKCSSNGSNFNGGLSSSSSSSSSNNEEEKESSLKEVVHSLVDERVENLLNKQENKVLLEGLEKAAERVENAKLELAQIQQQESQAKQTKEYVKQLEARAAEIEECQKEILEAQEMVEEAERSLDVERSREIGSLTQDEIKAMRKDKERLESVKAACISALVGTLASLPYFLTQVTNISELIVPSAITLASCALYGVTFRYVIRRDLDDLHLKTGAATAFGIVKGLAILGASPTLDLNAGSLLSYAYDGGISVSENLLVFLFATVGLDLCMKLRILSPFPIESSD